MVEGAIGRPLAGATELPRRHDCHGKKGFTSATVSHSLRFPLIQSSYDLKPESLVIGG